MGLFSTRNNDGASGRGEPVNTVPAKDQRGVDKVARHHGCDTRAELYSAGTSSKNPHYDPAKAGAN